MSTQKIFLLSCILTNLVNFSQAASATSDHSLVLGTHVENREIKNQKDTFTVNDKNVCALLTMQPSTDSSVKFSWYHDQNVYFEAQYPTKQSSRYRVHGCVTAQKGNWVLKVSDVSGNVLVEKSFTVDVDSSQAVPETKHETTVEEKQPEAPIKAEASPIVEKTEEHAQSQSEVSSVNVQTETQEHASTPVTTNGMVTPATN